MQQGEFGVSAENRAGTSSRKNRRAMLSLVFATSQPSSVCRSRSAARSVSHGVSVVIGEAMISSCSQIRPTSIADSGGRPKGSSVYRTTVPS